MYINVTILNKGTYYETINVSAYYTVTPITLPDGEDYITVTLATRNITVNTFIWNTTNVPKSDYTVSAYATPVPNETDMINNNFTDGQVIVAMIRDIYRPEGFSDGKVDIRDVAAVPKLFGVYHSDSSYNSNCDVIYDGKIDMKDIALVAKHFGEVDI